mmetsp:Transcript_31568/g.71157  ORF Transcript_31568/g.71157 Transcript_31568/m.71157 type:complete len:393 (-) Transcript_31568:57-1235(-)
MWPTINGKQIWRLLPLLPWFNARVNDWLWRGGNEKWVPNAAETYTSFSDEPYFETYHQIASFQKQGFHEVTRFISVIGSFGASLSILSALDIAAEGQVIFFDANPLAHLWANVVLKIINLSRNPQEFLSYIYARDVELFEHEHGNITVFNQQQFLLAPRQDHWRSTLLASLSKEEAWFWGRVSASHSDFNSSCASCLWPVFDSRWLNVYEHWPTGGVQTSSWPPPWPSGHSLMYGLGFLSDAKSFETLKKNLHFARLELRYFEDVMDRFGPCHLPVGSNTLVFTMDMIDDGKFREFTKLITTPTCGQPMIWLRTHEPNTSTMCVHVHDKWQLSPCGDWDSSNAVIHSKTVRAVADMIRGVDVNPEAHERFKDKDTVNFIGRLLFDKIKPLWH